jgi:hypothetical protein
MLPGVLNCLTDLMLSMEGQHPPEFESGFYTRFR